jgi:rhamnose utilization protein RhaD (predicted bifunctional aldolase and dehydrogenase)
MNSRWDDAAAEELSDLDLLVYASRLIGAETSLVVWGGGNTSIKRVERDFRGREVRVLRVKGSGSDLKSIQRKDFPGVRMEDLLALLERDEVDDQEMVDYFAHALLEPASPRPSIETPLHGFLPADVVIHTHADAIVSLTNNDRCHEVLRQVYGDEVIALGYRRPGFPIAKQVARGFDAHPRARAILLEKHGTICWGNTVKEAYLSTIELTCSSWPRPEMPTRCARSGRQRLITRSTPSGSRASSPWTAPAKRRR